MKSHALKTSIPWLLLILIMPPWAYAKHLLHDPTQPSDFKTMSVTKARLSPHLQSTLIEPSQRMATINDTIVHIGDTIGTAKIIAINDGSVVLIDEGRTITLHLFDTDIRK